MSSLLRKTLEATGSSTCHFSCQAPVGFNGTFTASDATEDARRARTRGGEMTNVEAGPQASPVWAT